MPCPYLRRAGRERATGSGRRPGNKPPAPQGDESSPAPKPGRRTGLHGQPRAAAGLRAACRRQERLVPARRRQASPASVPQTSPSLLQVAQALPGEKKKAVQKVQAPAQPFIAFDPARLTDDESARRARPMFSCPSHDLYVYGRLTRKSRFGMYWQRANSLGILPGDP
jgi:hypothetical protein